MSARGRTLIAVGLLVLLGTSPRVRGQQAPAGGQRPVFRSAADLVALDVTVRAGDRAVSGLTPADFVLLDNGVRQRVESVDPSAMPLDVTLVADASGRTSGAFGNEEAPEAVLEDARLKLRDMAAVLRPGDRIRMILSDAYVRRMTDWQTPDAAASQETLAAPALTLNSQKGLSAMYDALVTAMLEPVEPARRHAVVAWTKAIDTISVTDAAALRAIAQQSDAVLHIVQRDIFVPRTTGGMISFDQGLKEGHGDREVVPDAPPPMPQAPAPGRPRDMTASAATETNIVGDKMYAGAWRPYFRSDVTVLSDAATMSGGTFLGLGVLGDRNVASVFKDLFEEYRHGYVLRYAPTGVKREGWHDVAVSVPGAPKAKIMAGHGYAIEASGALGTETENPGAATAAEAVVIPATVRPLVAFFNRGDDAATQAAIRQTRDLRAVIRDYGAAETPWPSSPKLDAIFALEIAAAGLQSTAARLEAATLLDRHREYVRAPFAIRGDTRLRAARFECAWHATAAAAYEGALLAGAALRVIPEMIERCPDEPRLHLAYAIATDQFFSTQQGREGVAGGDRITVTRTDVIGRYERAMAYPDVAPEARVRSAWAAYREKDFARGLVLLDAVPASVADPVVTYYSHLFRAQLLRASAKPDEAIAEYRAAMTVFSGAQAARVGLMTLLLREGRRDEAEALAQAIETAPESAVDPWWVYWLGDYRSFSMRLAELREMAR